MEIKFIDISIKEKNNYLIKNLNITVNVPEIIGIYHDSYNIIKNLLLKKLDYSGKIIINGEDLNSIESIKISFLFSYDVFLTNVVSDEFYLVKKDLDDSNYIQKIISSLNMVGLSEDYLKREINSLSKAEKRLLKLALTLVKNTDIMFLESPFLYLDKNNKEKIRRILLELKKNYEKTIFIVDSNIDNLYSICEHFILFKDNQVLISNKRSIVFEDLAFLHDNDIELPNVLEFSYLANKYNKKISHFKDVKDLIKEVYRSATEIKDKISKN